MKSSTLFARCQTRALIIGAAVPVSRVTMPAGIAICHQPASAPEGMYRMIRP